MTKDAEVAVLKKSVSLYIIENHVFPKYGKPIWTPTIL